MQKAVFVVLLLLLSAYSIAQGQQYDEVDPWQGAIDAQARFERRVKVLTNQSIAELVKAGIDDGTILMMINTQPGNYTVGANDVITLKQAGVTDELINAMVHRSAVSLDPPADDAREARWAETPRSGSGDPSRPIPDDAGLYAGDHSGRFKHIEGRTMSFERSGTLLSSILTGGVHSAKINVQLPGEHARVKIGPNPVFYYRTFGSDEATGLDRVLALVLTRMGVRGGRRRFEIPARGFLGRSSGVSVRHPIDYDVREVAPGLYRLTPAQKLKEGQYAFYLLPGLGHASTQGDQGFVFDFQIE